MRALVLVAAAALGVGATGWLSGCGSTDAPNPFGSDAGTDGADPDGGDGGIVDGGPDADPTLGGPCTVDEQCDDLIDCTFDACDDTIERCRFLPDDSQCQNDAFCDGLEKCINKQGCMFGEPVSCSDGNPCNINTCDEENDDCLSEPRDVDQDGDPDDHCGGGDCDDADPSVSSLEYEICANGKDDDCDQETDEMICMAPTNDICVDPLELPAPGTYPMTTFAASPNYVASCGVTNPTLSRDVVAAALFGPGPLMDVQLTARTQLVGVALALMGQCADAGSEITCSPPFLHPDGGRVAKVRGRSLGDGQNQTAVPVYLFTEGASEATLRYELLPATTKPANETCGTATPLAPSTPTLASIVDAASDLAIACAAETGELVYSFDLAATQDVDLYATSTDGDGLPVLSLRDANCALPTDEIGCNAAASAHIYRHSLAAGTYYVAVAATAPTEVLVTLEISAPTAAPADEDCASAPAITVNQTFDVAMAGHQDDHHTGCLVGGIDAVYTLDLSQASDVLVIGRRSQGDVAATVLAKPPCAETGDELACGSGTLSPVRAQARNVPPGSYRVIAESAAGQPMQLTALVRPAVPPLIVPFANGCGDVLTIPATGAFLQGTTVNAQPDFNAVCDQGGQPQGGASDQLLKLELSQTKRVVLDMQGSAYATVLDVREGQPCPGQEVAQGCAAGYYPQRSYLDLELPAATYYIQVDGYAGQQGAWFLDVHVVDP
ncbi:MAG: putative metal-binding motif-containing protein [Deltaproteobacteria bacterium]|nr:putative metal-binding motif-containing protein [Deltaproteobacteria bacterium]